MYIEISEPYDREFSVVSEAADLRVEEFHMDRDRDETTGEDIISVRLVIIKEAPRGQNEQAAVPDSESNTPHCGWCGVSAADGARPQGASTEFSNRR